MSFDDFCISSYLTFRFVAEEGRAWKEGVQPCLPGARWQSQTAVHAEGQLLAALRDNLARACKEPTVGILLSGGIDSAVLAALLPRRTPAYTIRFVAEGAVDESGQARIYATANDLEHHVVPVTWQDHFDTMDRLMRRKMSPLHAVEVGLHKAASVAAGHGVRTLVVGNGADSTFGGLDKLLSRDWTLAEFERRYTFVNPAEVVRRPVSMQDIYSRYAGSGCVDVVRFLKEVHGPGVIQAFDNAIHAAGCATAEPYEDLRLEVPLNLSRIRGGESKYLLRALYKDLYPGLGIPEKIAFARPMGQWLSDWSGPKRPEFRNDLDMNRYDGDQRWLIFCLERFLDLMDER